MRCASNSTVWAASRPKSSETFSEPALFAGSPGRRPRRGRSSSLNLRLADFRAVSPPVCLYMTRHFKLCLLIPGGLLLVLALLALWYFQVPQHWLLDLRQSRSSEELRASSLWLPDYRVEIEARPVEGVSDLSALTYDPQRRSLFTVTNRYPELIELSLDGRVLRRIALHGFHDPEAVEYIGPGVLVIADERSQRLIRVRIADDTRELHADRFPELALSIGVNGNKGFEGLAFDPQGRRLFAGKERDPLRIF